MIFIGDISVPTKEHVNKLNLLLSRNKTIFNNKTLIYNLEGLLNEDLSHLKNNKIPIIFNHPSVPKVFNDFGQSVALLSNNHTLDLPKSFKYTKNILDKNKVKFTGSGLSRFEAEQPIFLKNNENDEVILLNYSWEFLLHTQKNPKDNLWVSVYRDKNIVEEIKTLKRNYPQHKIAIYFHWSFDLETLPFPAYRTLSKDLIDNGADIVVGTHSHCVQGGEKYKDGYIIYGLGNFYFPNNEYLNGNLSFPQWANKTLVIDWDIKLNKVQCHWFNIKGKKDDFEVSYLLTEDFQDGELITQHSPFRQMENKAYNQYFKLNRRKSFLLPILKYHKNYKLNKFKLKFIILRAKFARFAAAIKLRQWQN